MSTTRHVRVHAPLAAAALVLALSAGLSACSDDDGSSAAPSDDPTSEAVGYDGFSPDDLVACLGDAGVPSRVGDTVPFGVEVPVVGVDADGGATLWVFEDAAAAEADRAVITLSDTDTPLSRLVDNVVVQYESLDTAPVDAVDGCLA